MTGLQDGLATMVPSNPEIGLENATEADVPFLEEVYISTRWEELKPVTFWNEEEKRTFLQSQFQAQRNHYGLHYKEGSFFVILINGERAGRLYLYGGEKEIRIVDIALIPAFRNRGIGSNLLQDLKKLAVSFQVDLTIHVEIHNPAMNLYLREGFIQEGQPNGVYLFLRWKNK